MREHRHFIMHQPTAVPALFLMHLYTLTFSPCWINHARQQQTLLVSIFRM